MYYTLIECMTGTPYNECKEVVSMKKLIKLFAILFSLFIMLICCSCKTKDNVNIASSTPAQKENSKTLLRVMSASGEIENIESITLLYEDGTTASQVINNKADMEFLQKYTFSHSRTDKRERWDEWLKENKNFCIKVDTKIQGAYQLYVMQDGSIAIQQMCGDSEVPEIAYDFYKADKENVLTKENFETLCSNEYDKN